MKKVFAIVLIVCLAMTAVFADKGDFKVGAQVGYGSSSLSIKYNDDNFVNVGNGGFYFAGTAEYSLSDAFAGKVELGINTMGKPKATGKVIGAAYSHAYDETSPLQFSAYVGLQYNIEVSKDLDLGIGAGWDMMIGKVSSDDDAKTNAAMGAGFEVVAAFKMNKNVAITLGTKLGLLFINSDDDIDDTYTTFANNDCKVSQTAIKFFAGITYKI